MRKNIFRLIIICLAALVLFACSTETPPAEDTTADPGPAETTAPPPVDRDLSGYAVVRAEKAEADVISVAAGLYTKLADLGGMSSLGILDDWVRDEAEADNDKLEILVGLTNRPESEAAQQKLVGYLDYSITVTEHKICISAYTVERLQAACDAFAAAVTLKDGKAFYTAGNVMQVFDYPLKNLSIDGEPISSYRIVLPVDATSRESAVADQLVEFVRANNGFMLSIADDSAPETEHEILIGKTNRAPSAAAASLGEHESVIRVEGGKLVLAAASSRAYATLSEDVNAAFTADSLKAGFESKKITETLKLDGARVAFIGNSFIYYGDCVDIYDENAGSFDKYNFSFNDQGYFKQLCTAMGADVTVTGLTPGGATLKSNYERLLKDYPNHYGSGAQMDEIYDQDFVILQQAGSNDSSTNEYARKLMELFPPDTQFAYFVHHHNAQNNHSSVIATAKKLQQEGKAIYLSQGHLIFDVWKGKTAVPGATLSYNQDSFCVNQPKDRHHPNYLNGYLLSLMVYHAITGESVVDCPHDFVADSLVFYKNGATSNYPEILKSDADMRGLKQLVEEYYKKYNP